ncbi:phosphoprotein [Parajeilongvirus diaemi]|nr:phosphoprotein [Diaemus bat paramyxovirus]
MTNSLQEKQLESINNGLSAIEFIQKNKDEIQRTYGRSSITGPTTRDRTTAWEEFLSENPGSRDGSNNASRGQKNSEESFSCRVVGYYGQSHDRSGVPESSQCSAMHNRDNGSRDGKDDPLPDDSGIHRHSPCSIPDDCIGGVEWSRDDEFKGSITQDRDDAPDLKRVHAQQIIDGLKKNISKRVNAVSDDPVTKESFAGILGGNDCMPPKRLTNIAIMDKIIDEKAPEEEENTVKKGIEENSQLKKLAIKSSLNSGATPFVPRSHLYPDLKNVDVGNVPKDAQNVSMTNISSPDSVNSFYQTTIESKLDKIIENQATIINKLQEIPRIKNEIENIKRILNNHGLVISTIENYISDLMIVIPGSGQQDSNKPVNPDLRMVIGRDHTRGIDEVTTEDDYEIKIDESTGLISIKDKLPTEKKMSKKIESTKTINDEDNKDKKIRSILKNRKVEDKHILKDLDHHKNHAANFVPSNDSISMKTIFTLIDMNIDDKEIKDNLKSLVLEYKSTMSMKEINDIVSSIIDEQLKTSTIDN